MSEAFPAMVPYDRLGNAVSSSPVDVLREAVDVRPFMGGIYNMLPTVGSGAATRAIQKPFLNGSASDLTVNGSGTPQVYSVTPSSQSVTISGVGLEMVTSNNIVFNGSAFGGQYYVGLLFPTLTNPGALAKGLLLQVTSAGVTTALTNLTVNEDFIASQVPLSGGSLTGTTDIIRCRYEMRQPLVLGTSDALTWTVRDNLASNQGIVEIRSYAWGQTTG